MIFLYINVFITLLSNKNDQKLRPSVQQLWKSEIVCSQLAVVAHRDMPLKNSLNYCIIVL